MRIHGGVGARPRTGDAGDARPLPSLRVRAGGASLLPANKSGGGAGERSRTGLSGVRVDGRGGLAGGQTALPLRDDTQLAPTGRPSAPAVRG